jgi:hypothetical protein
MDLEDLKSRLREAARTGKPDGYTMLATSEWADAANAIESLWRDLREARTEIEKQRRVNADYVHLIKQQEERLRKYEEAAPEAAPELIDVIEQCYASGTIISVIGADKGGM